MEQQNDMAGWLMEEASFQQGTEIIIDLTDIVELGGNADADMPGGGGEISHLMKSGGEATVTSDDAGKESSDVNQTAPMAQDEICAGELFPPVESSGIREHPTIEQRLADAEKTIMALCAEVSSLRASLAHADYSSEVFLIHAAQATQGINCAPQYLLPENASEKLNDAVCRVEKLENRMQELENISERSAAETAAQIIREEISALKQHS